MRADVRTALGEAMALVVQAPGVGADRFAEWTPALSFGTAVAHLAGFMSIHTLEMIAAGAALRGVASECDVARGCLAVLREGK